MKPRPMRVCHAKRIRAGARFWLAAVAIALAAGGGCVHRVTRGPSGPAPAPTAEQRARVEGVVAQQAAPDKVTGDLVELLTDADWTVARLAQQGLQGRPLNGRHVQRLERIVASFPFRNPRPGPMATDVTPRYRSSSFAWKVLADEYARTRSVAEQVAWLIPQLQRDQPFGWCQADEAAQRLQKLGAPAVPALVTALQTGNGYTQLWVARTLRSLPSPEGNRAVVAWAIPRLRDTEYLYWFTAAYTLGELGEASAFEPMVAALWQHVDDYSRDPRGGVHGHGWAIISALPKVGGRRAIAPLRQMLTDYPPDARHRHRAEGYAWAAAELARLGDPLGRRTLEEAATSDLADQRRSAAMLAQRALGAEARPLLQRLAQDKDKSVCGMAEMELQTLRAMERQPSPPKARPMHP